MGWGSQAGDYRGFVTQPHGHGQPPVHFPGVLEEPGDFVHRHVPLAAAEENPELVGNSVWNLVQDIDEVRDVVKT